MPRQRHRAGGLTLRRTKRVPRVRLWTAAQFFCLDILACICYAEKKPGPGEKGGKMMERGKTFVMSYSCGKDSTLALHKMLAAGHTPLALLVMFNPEAGRSYFHGADHALLARYAEALQIPLKVLALKKDILIAGIVRGRKNIIPSGEDVIMAGDRVIILAAGRAVSTLSDILE